ncbi:FAD synthetase family protein [Spirochaeta cellobiosiphila]|uniref:FAD synthetase family protein n=1 Tax=Spirochaeta cellobiosiphila TaxID=504483 RepID=UPI00040BC81E|nr:FAD synthetase family protein [Spirochaeta cellobiosiphila]
MNVLSWDKFRAKTSEKVPSAITIGVYDGVHIGHKSLIANILDKNLYSIVFTFGNSPKSFRKSNKMKSLMSIDDRLLTFASMGIDEVVLIDFSPDFSKLTGEDFLQEIEKKSDLRQITIGFNFHCGKDRDTNSRDIESRYHNSNTKVDIIDPVFLGSEKVSSSTIRLAIQNGNLQKANDMLGRKYYINIFGKAYEQEGVYVIYKNDIPYQLPKTGVYPITIQGENNTLCSTELEVYEDKIRWVQKDGSNPVCIVFES